MTNDSLVSIVNTTVYGRSKKYRLEDTSEVTLVQWAVETKQLLLAHPELAKAERKMGIPAYWPAARWPMGKGVAAPRGCRQEVIAVRIAGMKCCIAALHDL